MDVGSIVIRMRLLVLSFGALFLFAACGQLSTQTTETYHKTSAACSSTAVAKQYVVRWKDGTTTIHKNISEDELLNDVVLPNESEIEIAEQDQKVSFTPPTTDTLTEMSSSSESTNWGQEIVEASSAWNEGQKGSGVVVAVIDSGVQLTHPQLKSRIHVNPGESGTDSQGQDKATNGVDDDGNGYVDDVSGYDFANNSASVSDGSGHGTHVAGIIAADSSQGSITGVAPEAKILPLDFMTDDGSGNISDAIRAINYAAEQGAKVINASWGGAPCSSTLQRAIEDLDAKGILFVVASGNSGVDLESEPEYPAAFEISNQVTVGASTNRDYMAVFSNYSYSLVHIMAPGVNITSTYPTSTTYQMSGTSMAAPFVTGAAAILYGARPNATPSEVKSALLASVDGGAFQVSSRGRLNIRKALSEIQKLPE